MYFYLEITMKKLFFAFALFVTACVSTKSDDTAVSEPSQSEPSEPSTSTDCTDAGSFQECANCFADENPAGAAAYDSIAISACYCGTECATDCADFCADTENPDPSLITQECGTCVNSVGSDRNSQCAADFSAACGADQNCIAFATDLQGCPQN